MSINDQIMSWHFFCFSTDFLFFVFVITTQGGNTLFEGVCIRLS